MDRKNFAKYYRSQNSWQGLTAKAKFYWRYRIGNYRLISDINEETVTILILKVGHRNDVYQF